MPLRTIVAVGALLASAVWVFFDARERDWTGDRVGNEPWIWAFGVLVFWILLMPLYLIRRRRRPAEPQTTSGRRRQYAAVAAAAVLPAVVAAAIAVADSQSKPIYAGVDRQAAIARALTDVDVFVGPRFSDVTKFHAHAGLYETIKRENPDGHEAWLSVFVDRRTNQCILVDWVWEDQSLPRHLLADCARVSPQPVIPAIS